MFSMSQTHKKNFPRFFIVVLIILVALFVRIRAVNSLPIDVDETTYLNAGLGYTRLMREGDIKGIAWYNNNAEHPPLVKIFYGVSFLPLPPIDEIQEKDLVVGDSVFETDAKKWLLMGRYVTMVGGLVTVAVLAWINPVAGLLLAVHTSAVRYSSQIGLEAVPALTAFLCVLAYEQWVKRHPVELDMKSWGWLVLSSIMLGLTASSKYVYCVAGLAIGLHMAWQGWRKKWQFSRMVQVLLLWGGLAVLVFLASDPFLWPRPFSRLMESIQYHFSFASKEHVSQYGYPFWQPLFYLSRTAGQEAWFWIRMDLPIMILAVLGLYPLRKKPLNLIWLAISMVFLLVWKTKWPQYVMILLVPYCLAAAEGVKMLWSWGQKRMKKRVA